MNNARFTRSFTRLAHTVRKHFLAPQSFGTKMLHLFICTGDDFTQLHGPDKPRDGRGR